MTLKPDPNLDGEKREIGAAEAPPGGDRITVYGDVGPGSVVGRGSVTADKIVGGNMLVNGNETNTYTQFADLLTELEGLIEEAKKAGELDEQRAKDVKEQLETASQLIKKEKKPPKNKILAKLQHVAAVIDNAIDAFEESDSPLKWLIKALPMTVLLIKLAGRIF